MPKYTKIDLKNPVPLIQLVRGPWHATWWQQPVGEFIATLFFMLGANGGIISANRLGVSPLVKILVVALCTAFSTYPITVVFAAIGVLTAFNGGITLAHFAFYALIEPKMRTGALLLQVAAHLVAQYLGALLSLVLLGTMYSHSDIENAYPIISSGITTTEAFAAEMLLSVFVYTIFIFSGAVQLRQNPSHLASIVINDRAFLFGLLTAAAILVGGSATGTYINPTRYLAIATYTWRLDNPLVWCLAPWVGSVITLVLLLILYLLFDNYE